MIQLSLRVPFRSQIPGGNTVTSNLQGTLSQPTKAQVFNKNHRRILPSDHRASCRIHLFFSCKFKQQSATSHGLTYPTMFSCMSSVNSMSKTTVPNAENVSTVQEASKVLQHYGSQNQCSCKQLSQQLNATFAVYKKKVKKKNHSKPKHDKCQ